MRGDVRVMIATNAFGMGIDKADIRFVVHDQMPGSIDAYYQETGRAGRDGEEADCILLFDLNDRRVQQFLQLGRYPERELVERVREALGKSGDASAAGVSMDELAQTLGDVGRNKLQVALRILLDAGLVRRNRARRYLRRDNAEVGDALALASALRRTGEARSRRASADHRLRADGPLPLAHDPRAFRVRRRSQSLRNGTCETAWIRRTDCPRHSARCAARGVHSLHEARARKVRVWGGRPAGGAEHFVFGRGGFKCSLNASGFAQRDLHIGQRPAEADALIARTKNSLRPGRVRPDACIGHVLDHDFARPVINQCFHQLLQ
jgi:superfamily II DNA/RNA helicase